MKQIKELRLERRKKFIVIMSLVCVLFLLMVLGLRRMHKQELPRDFKSKYEFNSGVTTHEKTYASTPAIYFPESIRQEGNYVINNSTGYQLCVGTREEGFLFLGQGEHKISGKLLVFFVIKPETEETISCKGEFVICRENDEKGFRYTLNGNQNKIKNISFGEKIL